MIFLFSEVHTHAAQKKKLLKSSYTLALVDLYTHSHVYAVFLSVRNLIQVFDYTHTHTHTHTHTNFFFSVRNLMQFLEFSKELGWQVVGSAIHPNRY